MIAALLLAVACSPLPTCTEPITVSPCASPTPMLAWDKFSNSNLSGYDLYYRESGGAFQLLKKLPCQWLDLDADGSYETRFCRGVNLPIPLQRVCPSCLPFNEYEFAITAYDFDGGTLAGQSNVETVCFSPICTNTAATCPNGICPGGSCN